MSDILSTLVAMSTSLGRPENDYVIMGEGNTSARADADTFWVKASGYQLGKIDAGGFARVRFEPALAMLEMGDLPDSEIKELLIAATVDNPERRWPSVETTFHALALTLGEANFVGHTHPAAVNALTCSRYAEEAASGRLFPDEIVVCGPANVFVPYTDPGLPLARAIRDGMLRYMDAYGETPKVILLQNHGLIALGKSAQEVENITAMYVKTARILLGAYAAGGPNFLSLENIARIQGRPDEHYRQRMLGLQVSRPGATN